MRNLNPYVLLMEDKSTLNIYSLLEKSKAYKFKLSDQFLAFCEMAQGSIKLGADTFYRH
jgi:hypothetical protein